MTALVTEYRRARAGRTGDFPENGGMAVKCGDRQIAVFHFAARGEWFACQNACPHRTENVLARGIIGDREGEPKVTCPMHKKNFSLRTGECLSDNECSIQVYDVRVENGEVFILLPE